MPEPKGRQCANKPATSVKGNWAENVAVMGKGRKTLAKGSRFLELKSSIVNRLKIIHQLLKDCKEKGYNAKEVIKIHAYVREQIHVAVEEWNEIDVMFKKEARKTKSKFTIEELEIQGELVRGLQNEIEKEKDTQMRGYTKKDGATGDVNKVASHVLNSIELYNDPNGVYGTPSWNVSGRNAGVVALTDHQKQHIMQFEERDADFDRQLDEIGAGIQDLTDIVALKSEEVEHQTVLLESVDNKMDVATERMDKANRRIFNFLRRLK